MTDPVSKLSTQKREASVSSQGNLLGLLTAAFYILFTLLPDSNTRMVEWPWVLFWQVGLLCPVFWLLGMLWQRRIRWLGNRLDWIVGLLVLGLAFSTVLATFPAQARWYGWAVLCMLAALYALNSWLNAPHRRVKLLVAQGYLNLAFILVSLVLWVSQILLPELVRLNELNQYGVNLAFDFSTIELRNGFPIGHQNYVAGYLVLALPLLLGLVIVQTGWRRWVWLAGVGLGLIDLYTTSSRGGWLGLALLALIGFVVLSGHSKLPRRWIWASGIAGLVVLVLLLLANNRLRSLITGLFSGQGGGELAYRLITVTIGWQMGLNHFFAGVGPGGVPLLYQQYRPAWAGREAEWHYQLHSTPAQLWAELGMWAVLVVGGAISLLAYLSFRWLRSQSDLRSRSQAATPPVLIGCLLSGLLGYAIVSLTDYQLDNLCISGTLAIYLAILAAEFRQSQYPEPAPPKLSDPDQSSEITLPTQSSETKVNPQPSQPSLSARSTLLPLAGIGLLLAVILWLVPIHRAWMLSSQGFTALNRKDVNAFAQQLNQAHQLALWEPYYSYQLGWNLGNLSLQVTDVQQQQVLVKDGASSMEQGIQASPYQEFGYTNLGWLLLPHDAKASGQAFSHSAQLVPAKHSMFFGLGFSLLAQGKNDLAVEAMTLECLRDPIFITSPVWKLPDLLPLYSNILNQMEGRYTVLLDNPKNSQALITQLHQSRGGLRWWQENVKAAHEDLDNYGSQLSQLVLSLAENKSVQSQLNEIQSSAGTLAVSAWLDPVKRQDLLRQAWIKKNRTVPDSETLQQLVETMARSSTLDQWLKQNAPSRQFRRERVGFGVLSRHADGPSPVDFQTVIENIPISQFFDQLIPSPRYAPELDRVLQPERDRLLQKIQSLA